MSQSSKEKRSSINVLRRILSQTILAWSQIKVQVFLTWIGWINHVESIKYYKEKSDCPGKKSHQIVTFFSKLVPNISNFVWWMPYHSINDDKFDFLNSYSSRSKRKFRPLHTFVSRAWHLKAKNNSNLMYPINEKCRQYARSVITGLNQ